MCHDRRAGNGPFRARPTSSDDAMRERLPSSRVADAVRRSYNRCPGGRAPRGATRRARPPSVFRRPRRAVAEGAVMTDISGISSRSRFLPALALARDRRAPSAPERRRPTCSSTPSRDVDGTTPPTPRRAPRSARGAALDARGRAGIAARSPWSDPRYPAALAAIADPPLVLWAARQRRTRSTRPAVAIVGSRAGVAVRARGGRAPGRRSRRTRRRRRQRAGARRRFGGASRRAGRRAASTVGGARVGRRRHLSAGARRRWRARSTRRAARSSASSCPGTPPLPCLLPAAQPHHQRPRRGPSSSSRRASGAGRSSRRDCALEQGRDVLAVPGNVLSGRNRGAHALLRDGAKIVETADDILEELGLPVGPPGAAGRPGSPAAPGRPGAPAA